MKDSTDKAKAKAHALILGGVVFLIVALPFPERSAAGGIYFLFSLLGAGLFVLMLYSFFRVVSYLWHQQFPKGGPIHHRSGFSLGGHTTPQDDWQILYAQEVKHSERLQEVLEQHLKDAQALAKAIEARDAACHKFLEHTEAELKQAYYGLAYGTKNWTAQRVRAARNIVNKDIPALLTANPNKAKPEN